MESSTSNPATKPKKRKSKKTRQIVENKKLAIGIDLGTTYSCVGIYRNGAVDIVANDLGNRTTPSIVSFDATTLENPDDVEIANAGFVVGEAAKQRARTRPTQTVFGAKRLIGRALNDPSVQEDMATWPFQVVPRPGGDTKSGEGKVKPMVKVTLRGEERLFSAEEISAMVLVKMKQTAEAFVGQDLTNAVITCPAYFSDAQRSATKLAGDIAGLNVLRVINEPTAAAIAYGFDTVDDEKSATTSSSSSSSSSGLAKKAKSILVFDLGGGTFDVSILSITEGVFEVKGTGGDTHLGGEDLDSLLVTYCLDEFARKHRKIPKQDYYTNPRCLRKLRTSCERAKRALSASPQATVEVESFTNDMDLIVPLTRARFEALCYTQLMLAMETVSQVLREAKMERSQIDEVVLVGGSTRIPKIAEMIGEFFGKEPNNTINPDEAVAYGAAIQAAILSGDTSKETQNMLLVDVAPLSLGMEVGGGAMSVFIPRNTRIPHRATKLFSTYQDNQTEVEVCVYEGERAEVRHNNLLGKFELEGIPPAPMGVAKIEVCFALDANGILSVSATEKETGRVANVVINDSCRLNSEQVAQMVAESVQFKQADELRLKTERLANKLAMEVKDIETTINDPSLHIGKKDYDQIAKCTKWLGAWMRTGSTKTVAMYEEQLAKLSEYVDPILNELFKGRNLAARNMGLMESKKRKITALIKSEEYKQLTHKKAKSDL